MPQGKTMQQAIKDGDYLGEPTVQKVLSGRRIVLPKRFKEGDHVEVDDRIDSLRIRAVKYVPA